MFAGSAGGTYDGSHIDDERLEPCPAASAAAPTAADEPAAAHALVDVFNQERDIRIYQHRAPER